MAVRAARAGRAGRGGPGGPGGFALGGRGGRQNAYSATSNYTFGGSVLDSAPYQLRDNSPVTQLPYTRQSYGGTVGGPLKIPHIYNGARTSFMLNYTGNHGANLFDQYATVPTDAMRSGDFSTAGVTIVNPLTGQPFAGNRIPTGLISPTAQTLLAYIPAQNLDGASRNFHHVTTTSSAADNVNLRVTHNFTQTAAGRGGRGGPGGGGGRGGPGGRAGRGAQQGTSASMTAQLQYRRNDNDQTNIFPSLGGTSLNSSLSVPVTLNVVHKRIMHNVTVNLSRTEASTFNRYAFIEDVTGAAGIAGVSTDPFDWGLPQLSFSSLASLRDVTPSRRTDSRLSMGYGWTHPSTRHTLRAGADVRLDNTNSQTDVNPNGAFVFTGLYASGGAPVIQGGGTGLRRFPPRRAPAGGTPVRPGRREASRQVAQPLCAGRLAQERDADVQPGRSLRAALALCRGERPDGQSRHQSGFHRRGPGAARPVRTVLRHIPERPHQPRRQQRGAAVRLRVADQAGPNPARRLRRELQLGRLLDDRPAARRPAAIRGDQHQHRHGRPHR